MRLLLAVEVREPSFHTWAAKPQASDVAQKGVKDEETGEQEQQQRNGKYKKEIVCACVCEGVCACPFVCVGVCGCERERARTHTKFCPLVKGTEKTRDCRPGTKVVVWPRPGPWMLKLLEEPTGMVTCWENSDR